MKSIGLALTIFALIGTLAALDLCGANQVLHVPITASTPNANASSLSLASAASKDKQEALEEDDEEDEADEGDGKLVNTFLVTPRPSPVASSTAVGLRYD
jgi:hypothetical protein